jgi:hypothetical protein
MARSLSHAEENFLERADGWLKRMSPRLFVALNFYGYLPGERLDAILAHPFMRRVHWARFFLSDHQAGASDALARSIAAAPVLDRLLFVRFSVPYFCDVSDGAWGLLAERFREIGWGSLLGTEKIVR